MTFSFERVDVTVNTIKIDDGFPVHAAVNPKTGILYLSYPLSNFVIAVDTRSKRVAAKIKLNLPQHIAINSQSDKVYVDCADGIYVVDGTERRVIGAIEGSRGATSGRIAIDQRNNIIYTTCLGGKDTVAVIDGSRDSITANVKSGGKGTKGIAYDERSKQVFVVNSNSNSISAINGTSNLLVDTFKIKVPLWYTGPKKCPQTVLVNSALKLLYVTMRTNIRGKGGPQTVEALYVVDLERRKAIGKRMLDFVDEDGVAFDPVGSSLYIRKPKIALLKLDAYGKVVSSVKIEKGNILERIAPHGWEAIAVNPSNKKVYLTNNRQNLLYELDG
jgi:DNA-binding beta-propeller fold protein YncE